MELDIREPEGRISKKAVTVWRLSNTIGHGITLLVFAGLIIAGSRFGWWDWAMTVLWIFGGLTALSAVYSILIEPVILQRTWRYGADEEFVQMRHGVLTVQHQTVPMTKVQYVGLEQGPLLRKYGLYTLTVGTMGSNHSIPALPEQEAKEFRNRIARLAKIREEEE
ncbi:PH domain-containing protein [Bhargavaea beijingensis]|uniref:YdbS-like PH domain-containing protein n=1 Tax=Bhargavaea beijingensis TaxID=426756 RepID=A0A1G6XIN7_9BACL|nr:PH domain-containing protein [Bhargavaea beijingensis]MCW1928071.1 PH domain-containing protein [Bhargavaea beijingensis]SDD77931.1 hypothetical protein SAMN04488126_10170 [Bhargavaea beijingensis]